MVQNFHPSVHFTFSLSQKLMPNEPGIESLRLAIFSGLAEIESTTSLYNYLMFINCKAPKVGNIDKNIEKKKLIVFIRRKLRYYIAK
jgi:hypothetical protein